MIQTLVQNGIKGTIAKSFFYSVFPNLENQMGMQTSRKKEDTEIGQISCSEKMRGAFGGGYPNINITLTPGATPAAV